MHSLSRALLRQDDSNEKLEFGWPVFDPFGISIRRGEMHMIAAGPGGGKSTLALRMALSMKDYRVLYICCDTAPHTINTRALMMLANDPALNADGKEYSSYSYQIEEDMKNSPLACAKRIEAGTGHIAWRFVASPSVDDINLLLAAYREVNGVFPDVVIVDNLSDIDHGADQEHIGLKAAMKDMSKTALGTSSAFIVLHHINEGGQHEVCPPMKAITGKVSQKAALILTLEANDVGDLFIAPVKNRYGVADITGNRHVAITWKKDRMVFKGYEVADYASTSSNAAPVNYYTSEDYYQ